MRHVIILCGAPASGKSTLAKLIQSYGTPKGMLEQDCVPILSLDSFRHLMCPTHIDNNGQHVLLTNAARKPLIEAYFAAVEAHMRIGATLILDNTHCVWRNIREAWELAKKYSYKVTFVKLNVDANTIKERDKNRHGSEIVGEVAISRMTEQLKTLKLPKNARVIELNNPDQQDFETCAHQVICDIVSLPINITDDSEHLIIIGDIHSYDSRLQALEQELTSLEHPDRVHLVFVGDLLDRGPDTCSTVLTLRRLRAQYKCTFIEGNHDWHMRRLLAEDTSARDRFADTAKSFDELAHNPDYDLLYTMYEIIDSSLPAAVFHVNLPSDKEHPIVNNNTYIITHAGIALSEALYMAAIGHCDAHISIADCVFGCGERNNLYNKQHPSDYTQDSITAACGINTSYGKLISVHGHREWTTSNDDTHIDLESRVWTDDGCLSTLWVNTRNGKHEIRQYH